MTSPSSRSRSRMRVSTPERRASTGTPNARSCSARIGSRSPGCSRRRTRSRFTRPSSEGGGAVRASTGHTAGVRPSRSTPGDHLLGHVVVVRRDGLQRRPAELGATCEDHNDEQATGPQHRAGPGQPRGRVEPSLAACTRKSGPLSTSRSTASHGPAGAVRATGRPGRPRRRAGTAPRRARQLGDPPAAAPTDDRPGELDDDDRPTRGRRAPARAVNPSPSPPTSTREGNPGAAQRPLGQHPRCRCRRCPSRRRR